VCENTSGCSLNLQTFQGQWQIVGDSYSLFFSAQQRTPISYPRRLPDGISRLLPTPYPSTNTLSTALTSTSFSTARAKDQPYFALSSITKAQCTTFHYTNNVQIRISHWSRINFLISTLTLSEAHLPVGFPTNPPNHSCLPFSSAGQQPCNSHLPSQASCWCCHLYRMFATYSRSVRGPSALGRVIQKYYFANRMKSSTFLCFTNYEHLQV
jgi:hypothetical protein